MQQDKGFAITNSDQIRTVHNSFARYRAGPDAGRLRTSRRGADLWAAPRAAIGWRRCGRAEALIFDDKPVKAKDSDDLFHFVSFLPFEGRVYELDGLAPGPVFLGPWPTVCHVPLRDHMVLSDCGQARMVCEAYGSARDLWRWQGLAGCGPSGHSRSHEPVRSGRAHHGRQAVL